MDNVTRLREQNTAGGCKLQIVPIGLVDTVPPEYYGGISSAITLLSGSWTLIEPTRFTQEFSESWERPMGAQMAVARVAGVIPKDRVSLLWNLWHLHGDRYLVLVHDHNGTIKLMGTKEEPAIVRIEELTHGRDPRGDRNQYVLTAEVSRRSACPFYLADAPLVGGDPAPELPVEPETVGRVRVATTASIDLASAPATIDGVTLDADDRVLVKNQAAPAANGVYVWNGAGVPMTRALDYAAFDHLANGLVVVDQGTANADTMWYCTSNAGGTLNTTAVTYIQFGGSGANVFTDLGDVPASYAGHGGKAVYVKGTEDGLEFLPAGGVYTADEDTLQLVADEFSVKDVELLALAGLTSAANKVPRFTGVGTADLLDFDVDGDLSANSDTRIASQKAVKTYVDGLETELKAKNKVRAASTANVTVATAPAALDGVTLANGDRVLLRAQTLPEENGVYVFLSAGSALLRTNDFATFDSLCGELMAVMEGVSLSDTLWLCEADLGGTLGVTAVNYGAIGGIPSHTHVSADITDASEGGLGAADAGKLVKFGGDGELKATAATGAIGAALEALDNYGATITSQEYIAARIRSLDPTDTFDIARFENQYGNGLFVKNNGALDWLGAGADDTRINLGLGTAAVEDAATTSTADAVVKALGTGKIDTSFLPDSILGQMEYQGGWNGSTNTPAIPAAATGNKGHYYITTVAVAAGHGYANIPNVDYQVGDWLVSNGTTWDKVDNTDAVASVHGRLGAVVAANGDYNAGQITNTPAGNIAAVTVQAALNELDSEKQPLDAALSALSGLPTTLGVIEQTATDVFTIRKIGAANATELLQRSDGDARYQALDADLTAIAALGTNGLVERTGAGTAAIRTIGTGAAADVPDRAAADLRYARIDKASAFIDVIGSQIGTNFTWSNMPAADKWLGEVTTNRPNYPMDLTRYTQARITAQMASTPGSTGAKVMLRYKATAGNNVADYIIAGSTEIETLIDTASATTDSGWIDLVAGAKADVWVGVVGTNGNGTADPVFQKVVIEFR